jgi:hypothetical protein
MLYICPIFKVSELMQKYAVLEEKVIKLRTESSIEVTSFLDDEIGRLLDKLSRQVARIDKRLFTYHEVVTRYHISFDKSLLYHTLP